jgi:20S proteasome alpha/beta subunit
MTLLVGVMCQSGAVFAADKQTTHGTVGHPTVGLPTTKISAIKNKVLFASSGYRGLGQQFAASLVEQVDGFERQLVTNSAKNIQAEFRKLVNPAFETAQKAIPLIGQMAAAGDVTCGSILAAKFEKGVSMIEITQVGAVEFYSEELPFICLGSGKQNSDPFLAYLWSVFFPPKTLPTLSEGVLMAYWTVKTAISLASPSIGLGIDVFVLDPKANPQTRELSEEELRPHDEFIDEAANALRSVRDTMRGKAEKLPDVPTLKS